MLLTHGQCPHYLLAEAITWFVCIKYYHRANNHGMYVAGFYNPMIDDKDGHIPSPVIVFTCTALHHPRLEWQQTKAFIRNFPYQS
jgi:hypothetical protein